MHWYGGSIAEAVTLSKQKNAIFVVFVEGDNDLSSEMISVLDDAAVLQRLADSTNFLAIRLKSGSTDYTHFAQIYQFVPVPSLFFIGRNGTPLEVVCAGVQPSNLAARIDRILEEHHKDRPVPASFPSNIKEQTATLLSSESTPAPGGSKAPATPAPVAKPVATPVAKSEPEPSEPAAKVPKLDDQEVVCNDGVCIRRPRTDGAGSSKTPDAVAQKPQTEPEAKLEATESTLSTEEKMERAKALIEAKKKEKAEKEKQLEKEKEKERRNLGQGVAELKRWQADQELKQIQEENQQQSPNDRPYSEQGRTSHQLTQREERKREKMENNLARQRILEQFALDRAERRARDAAPLQAEAEQQEQAAPATSGDGGLQARVQFKLPDGSAHTRHFPADSRLADLHQYVAENLNLPTAQFSLWLAFPRRELTDAQATLRRLELAPSAALLVLPRRAPAAVARPTAYGSIIAFVSQLLSTMILQPSQRLYTWLMSFVSPGARDVPPSSGDASPAPAATAALRRRGNVHRLQGDRPDDDNNTWNGNSTQQM